jgi:RNA polymerase sigma factor (sigma-70 family)
MTPDSEADLIQRAQAGDAAAEDALVRSFESMHQQFGREYSTTNRSAYRDLCQAARIGTLFAVRRFQPERGVSLGTFVHRYSRGYAQHEFARRLSGVAVSSTEDTDELFEGPPSEDLSPERLSIQKDLADKFSAALSECSDVDRIDVAIISRRLAAAASEPLDDIGRSFGVTRAVMRRREKRLKDEVLPRILSELRTP